jgi:hypothetical protein
MARKLADIIQGLDDAQAAQTDLSSLNSPSNTAIYTLWKYIVAVNMYLQETLWDIFKTDLEKQIDSAPVGSNQWLQKKAFEFQYSSTNPQVTTLVDYVPTYPNVDESLRIITRCSIKTTALNTVEIKVAKSEPPVALSNPELAAFDSYVTSTGDSTIAGAGVGIGAAGIYYSINSFTSDKLWIDADITYLGQYSSVIKENVEAAINNYLANIPFDGNFKVLSLVDAIQQVEGVTDILINNLALRADATAFASRTYLIQNNAYIYTTYPLYAGYAVEETTSSQTFTDTITYIAQ